MTAAESESVRLFGETPSSGATAVGVRSWHLWKRLPDRLVVIGMTTTVTPPLVERSLRRLTQALTEEPTPCLSSLACRKLHPNIQILCQVNQAISLFPSYSSTGRVPRHPGHLAGQTLASAATSRPLSEATVRHLMVDPFPERSHSRLPPAEGVEAQLAVCESHLDPDQAVDPRRADLAPGPRHVRLAPRVGPPQGDDVEAV